DGGSVDWPDFHGIFPSIMQDCIRHPIRKVKLNNLCHDRTCSSILILANMNQPTINPNTMIENLQQATELVRHCAQEGLPIVDYGLAHQGLGNPPPSAHQAITQTGKVLEHYPNDFVVCAEAGTTIGDLQTNLRSTGQFLPLDADDDLTLGE